MSDTLLATKFNLPVLRQHLVQRQALIQRLTEGVEEQRLLTWVCAPAGYGKTTTIRMWAASNNYPTAWLTLDESDNDLKQFLNYFLTAFQQVDDDLGQVALAEIKHGREVDQRHILGLLTLDLTALARPIVLVMEDYQVIDNKNIDLFIESILNQSIPNLHMVITSREDPNLPLTRLRARNQLTEFRASHLKFSLTETSEFITDVMGVQLSRSQMQILEDRTEGWVAGLQLAGLSLKESEDPAAFLEAFRGTHRHILHYLIEEVLASQPQGIQTFLRRTSILDQLSPYLCQAVTGEQASREYLDHLERSNLFLIPLDEARTWFRYHALFADLLRHQLVQAEPQMIDDLHERAAGWYQENGFIQKAVEHAFQIGDSGRVAGLIENHALPMLYRGEVAAVVGWFDRLPDSVLQSSPLMCIGKAWALALMLRQTRNEEVEQALAAAEAAAQRGDDDRNLLDRISGHAASIRAYLARSPGLAGRKAEMVIETSQQAQQLLPESEKAIRSVNHLNIGYGYQALANLAAAESAFAQAYDDGVQGGNFYAAVYGPISLIVIALMQGRLNEALELCETNIDRFNRLLAGQSFPPIGALYILKGSILLEGDRLDEADQALTLGLDLERWTGEFRAHSKGHAAMARLRAVQGDWTAMFDSLRSLEETRPEAVIHAQAWRHRLATRGGLADESCFKEAKLWLAQNALQFDCPPEITGLDPVSEVYFQAYLSALHIQSRLAARNPGTFALHDAHHYLAHLEHFAETHALVGWLVEIWIARAVMYQVEGRTIEAAETVKATLRAARECGFFRLILDEADIMKPVLLSLRASRQEDGLAAFVERLLETMPAAPLRAREKGAEAEPLSEREREVLALLAAGQTYKEIGQQLYLSLNTVQFHVKNIYGKLLVNKRTQAIEKARELELI